MAKSSTRPSVSPRLWVLVTDRCPGTSKCHLLLEPCFTLSPTKSAEVGWTEESRPWEPPEKTDSNGRSSRDLCGTCTMLAYAHHATAMATSRCGPGPRGWNTMCGYFLHATEQRTKNPSHAAKPRKITLHVLISITTAPTSTTGDLNCTTGPKLTPERCEVSKMSRAAPRYKAECARNGPRSRQKAASLLDPSFFVLVYLSTSLRSQLRTQGTASASRLLHEVVARCEQKHCTFG